MDEEKLIAEIERFYREYFGFTREEEAFLILYFSLLRKGGRINGKIMYVPGNIRKIKYLNRLKEKLLREVRK